ncbi:XdhC family protein [Phenylobacterium sp.]|uniref:XdhC family protein n=1 Tax=Phenylobacterium sp. TaxID=1871053 RepID=UPI00286AE376|nr:XdhC family protein [Phenylobacterium sp.]
MREPLPEWPLFGLADDVRPALAQARQRKIPMALATLIAVEGGGPRPVGTQMAFADGIVAGYFSGGCVESDVADHAFACLEDGEPRRLIYGEGSPWPDITLLCGARIEIFVEKVDAGDLALIELLEARDQRRPTTWVSDGHRRVCALEAEPWDGAVVRRHEPVPRLVVFGSDPTALAIAQLGVLSGLETTFVRSKGPEAPPPIDGLGYRRDDPQAALDAIGCDAWTSIAVATHNIDTDREALAAALPSAAGYVGLLGARKRLQERLAPMRAAGVPEEVLARVHAPIGLDIGGKAPWEVAVSVIGEIISLRYARTPEPSRDATSKRGKAAVV